MITTDKELVESFEYWYGHYVMNGDKHYPDTPDWKITELYWDLIVDRVLDGLPEMTDEENEAIIERMNNMF